MAGKIKVQLVTPRSVVLDKEVEEVIAPGILGEFGVLIGHTPMLTFIKPGLLSYLENDRFTKFVVGTGFCEVLKDQVTVLVDEAFTREEIDLKEAESAVGQLEQELAKISSLTEPAQHAEVSNKLKLARAKIALAGGAETSAKH
jgi:F-type H+-transporting ATPase subunit epsilon